MNIKDVFIIRSYKGKDDKEKSEWIKSGIAFENKDSSLNVEIYALPGVKFQIRDREEKKQDTPF